MTELSQRFVCHGFANRARVAVVFVPMTLTILEDTAKSLFLQLSGSLDVAGTCEIETRFLAHAAATKRPVVVDFSQVTFLASFGLRMILEAVRILDRNGKKLVVLNPQPLVAKALELGGINQIAVIVHDPLRGAPHGSYQVLR